MATTSEPVSYRIGVVTALFMFAFAIVADLLQFLLTLTVVLIPAAYLVTFFAHISLFVWLVILGVSYFGGRKAYQNLIAAGSSVIIELVPLISALPAITVMVAFIVLNSRAEDREKFKKNKPKNQNSVVGKYVKQGSGIQPQTAANSGGSDEEYRQAA